MRARGTSLYSLPLAKVFSTRIGSINSPQRDGKPTGCFCIISTQKRVEAQCGYLARLALVRPRDVLPLDCWTAGLLDSVQSDEGEPHLRNQIDSPIIDVTLAGIYSRLYNSILLLNSGLAEIRACALAFLNARCL